MGSGKTSTSTQSVSIPPEVLARYNAVNARAEGVADTPFQAYSSDPNAFVAPMNQVQQQGVGVIQNAGNTTPQYFNAAAGFTGAGAGEVNPQELDIGKYYNPFTSLVAGNVYDTLRQQQQEEMSGQTANAIKSGAFGSDRAGLASANLVRQQQLGLAGAMLPIFQQGYDQALGTSQQQQGVALSAEQQNKARQMQAGSQFAGLGTAQQGAELGLGQALLGAGTVGQQTEQAGLSALYNQFLQEKGYPFQVAQFLANIAMGTGALSGSTTTTTQPAPFFSDEDEKTNIQKLGDGLYAYDYKADVEAARKNGTPMPPKRVGPMAQEIEKEKPGLVIDVDDYKVVDPGHTIERAAGGSVGFDQDAIAKILANQAGMYAGMYGQAGSPRGVSGTPGGKTYVPQGSLPVGKLATASAAPQQRPSGLAEAAQTGSQIAGLAKMAKSGYDWTKEKVSGLGSAAAPPAASAPLDLGSGREREKSLDELQIGRGFAAGGSTDEIAPQGLYAPEGVGINIPDEQQKNELQTAGKLPEKGKSGLGEVMDAAKSVAQLAAMFFADGGAVPSDDELAARTILSEAGRDRRGRINPEEALGIAAVINNRAARRGLSPSDVVLEEGQFEPWAKPGGPNDPMKWSPDSPEYAQALALWQRARAGEDPTKGATHFWGPASQRALGREAPAWGRSGGLDIGATRFHSVPGYGAGEGQERQPPTGLAPEPSAERVTPGIAGPGRGPQDPASAPFKTLFGGMFSDVEDPSKRSALTSENLWVPALAGLGSMLASRSPYLGNAIGEGLVGGTKAYGDLNNAQHNQGLARANMESTMAGIADQALKVVDGRLMIRYARPNGQYDYISYQQYMALPPAERSQYKVDPRALSEAQKLAGAAGQAPVGGGGGSEPQPRVASPSPASQPATSPAPAAIPLPKEPTDPARKMPSSQPFGGLPSPTAMPHETGLPPRLPDRPTSVGGITIDPKTAEQAFLLTQQKAGYPSQDREKEPDFFTPQDSIAKEAESSKQLLMPLVGALAALPRDASWATSGPVQSAVMPFMKTINNLAQIAGLPPMKEVTTPSALQQEIEKLTAQMQRQDATAAQQRAYAALQEMAKGIPGILNSPEGQAKLIPQMLTNTQREIDRQNFFRAWANAAGGPNNEYANYARLSSRDANRAFDEKFNESYYQAERQKLEGMFNQMVRDDKGQRVSLMAWLAQNGAQMGPEQKKQIVDRYGPGVLRYFGVQ